MLTYADYKVPSYLHTDASRQGLGAAWYEACAFTHQKKSAADIIVQDEPAETTATDQSIHKEKTSIEMQQEAFDVDYNLLYARTQAYKIHGTMGPPVPEKRLSQFCF